MFKPVVLSALCLCAVVAGDKNSGLKVEVVTSSLKYLTEIAIKELELNLQDVTIPDVISDPGFMNYGVQEIKLDSFTVPLQDVNVTPVPGIGIKIETKNAYMGMNGNYYYNLGPYEHEHGQIAIHMSQFAISMQLGLGVFHGPDGRDRLSVSTSACQASVSKIDVKFSGSAFSGFVNLFRWIINLALRPKMTSLVCDQIHKDVDVMLNKALQQMSMEMPLGNTGVVLDASLAKAPTVLSTTFEIDVYGDSWLTGAPKLPYSPAPLPECPVHNRMFHVMVEEAMINSLLFAFQQTGKLQMVVDKDMVKKMSPTNAHYLNISCTDFDCLGAMLPTVNTKFGAGSLWINVTTATAPNITFTKEGNKAVINLNLGLDMRAKFDNGSIVPIFDVTIAFGIIMQNITLSAANATTYLLRMDNFDCTTPDTTLNSINVGGVTADNLQGLFQFAIPFGIGKVQPMIEAGIKIPIAPSVQLRNTVLQSLDRAFFLALDLNFST